MPTTNRKDHPPIQEIFRQSLATKRDFTIDVPRPQSWLSHFDASRGAWVHREARPEPSAFLDESGDAASAGSVGTGRLHVITWNVDFLVPWGPERMRRALEYLETDVVGPLMEQADGKAAVVLMFQEMTENDVELILETEWVRRWFAVSDEDTSNWGTPLYGTLTLISRTIEITRIFRLPLHSNMSRDGLFADVLLDQTPIRLCNLHLESLVADPPVRPTQVVSVANYMRDSRFAGAVAAGDCNAIQPFDQTLAQENGLRDCFLDLGGKEGEEEGNTWGYQEKEERFPPGRLDKVFYVSDEAESLKVERLEKIGVGVRVEGEQAKMMEEWADLTFVTDHYGLFATFTVGKDVKRHKI